MCAAAPPPAPSRPGRITAGELARVCAQYDLGTVEAVRKFHGGDRASAKVLLVTSTGKYLLKRRAAGQDDPYSVALAHHIVNALLEARFPAPPLVGTRRDNNSILQMDGAVYEVFRFVEGQPYDRSIEATQDAGRVLALFHTALAPLNAELAHKPSVPLTHRSYHAIEDMAARIEAARRRVNAPGLRPAFRRLSGLYEAAAARVRSLGFDRWPVTLIHGDWHPGNLMYRDRRVIAALDFDSARRAPAVIDVANALLQFSITRTGDDPAAWPAAPDTQRFAAMYAGYGSSRGVSSLASAQAQAVPPLMIEALIAEAITPIALTGRFGSVSPASIVGMAARKAVWLDTNGEAILNLLISEV